MKSALKFCSITQQLLVLVSGILLAYVLSADSRNPYQYALNEILAIGEDGARDLSNFIASTWLLERRSEHEILPIYRASNETLRRFAYVLKGAMDELGAGIDYEDVFKNTIFTDSKNQVRLKGWERPDLFLSLPSVDKPTVRRMLHYLERESLEGTLLVLPGYPEYIIPQIRRVLRQNKISLTEMTLVEIELLPTSEFGKGIIRPLREDPSWQWANGHFRLSFEKDTDQREPLLELDVVLPLSLRSFRIERDEWIKLQRAWYRSNGFGPERYVSGNAPFGALRVFESQIGNMKLSEATKWLREKASGKLESVNLLGISLEGNLVSTIGPIILIALMVGLISAVCHVLSLANQVRLSHEDEYWGVVSPSRIARGTSLVAISIVPGSTCVAMAVYSGHNFTILTLNTIGALVAVAVFLCAKKLVENPSVAK